MIQKIPSFYERSDHYNFAKFGIPSVFLMVYMQITTKKSDTPDKIEYDALAKRAKLAFTIAWELARENRPVVDKK
jgi:Zn-dependent M28 family amino/carboxypeptidase